MRKSMKTPEAEEVFRGPRLAAWLPEAEWEWHDRVHSNLWPCELSSDTQRTPILLTTPEATRRQNER